MIYLVNVTIGTRTLSTNVIIGIFGEFRVRSQSGSVHQIEQVAIICTKVQQR